MDGLINQKLWTITWDMSQHWNSALHETQQGHDLILEVDVNTQVRDTYTTRTCEIQRRQTIICQPETSICAGTLSFQ